MATKPTTKATSTETGTAQVLDRLEFDGKTYGPGDEVQMPLTLARQLRDLGVVAFVETVPAEGAAPQPDPGA